MGGYVNLFLHISLLCVCMFDFNLFDFICYFLCVDKNKEKTISLYMNIYIK